VLLRWIKKAWRAMLAQMAGMKEGQEPSATGRMKRGRGVQPGLLPVRAMFQKCQRVGAPVYQCPDPE